MYCEAKTVLAFPTSVSQVSLLLLKTWKALKTYWFNEEMKFQGPD